MFIEAIVLIYVTTSGSSYNLDVYCSRNDMVAASNVLAASSISHNEYSNVRVLKSACSKRFTFSDKTKTKVNISNFNICHSTIEKLVFRAKQR